MTNDDKKRIAAAVAKTVQEVSKDLEGESPHAVIMAMITCAVIAGIVEAQAQSTRQN